MKRRDRVVIEVDKDLTAFAQVLAKVGSEITTMYEMGVQGSAKPLTVITYETMRELGKRSTTTTLYATKEKRLGVPEVYDLKHTRGTIIGEYEEARVTGINERIVIEARRKDIKRVVEVEPGRNVKTIVDAPPRF